MEFRQLGKSGLKVPVLCFGSATFGGGNEFFRAWGATDVAEATRLIDLCMEAGVSFFDTADVYSQGLAEEILGEAIQHLPRDRKSTRLNSSHDDISYAVLTGVQTCALPISVVAVS